MARLLRICEPGLTVELIVVETSGDRRAEVPVWEMGGQGVFVKEVQAAVLEGRADVAVHSAKDLPSTATAGLRIAAYPSRADPRDALVGAALDDLAPGAVIATGSVRRRAQLRCRRPDLRFEGLRGSVPTRLGKVPDRGAVVVAAAALDRLGLADRAAQLLGTEIMVPQVGQAALAVECREDDTGAGELLGRVDDPSVRSCVEAERAWLALLGSGCDLPVGAHAFLDGDLLVIEAMVAAVDGSTVIRSRRRGPASEPEALGRELASEVLDTLGGSALLSAAR